MLVGDGTRLIEDGSHYLKMLEPGLTHLRADTITRLRLAQTRRGWISHTPRARSRAVFSQSMSRLPGRISTP